MLGKILLLCEDQMLASGIQEKIFKLGDYSVFMESSFPVILANPKQYASDLILIKPPIGSINTAYLISELKVIDPDAIIVVLLEAKEEAEIAGLIDSGAYDFLVSPVNTDRLKFTLDKGIKLHLWLAANRRFSLGLKENNRSLEKQNTLLAGRVEEATTNLSRLYEDLRSTYMRTIKVLAQAIDARDHYTHSHSENVALFGVEIASFMNFSVKEIEVLRQACELHDLGKIGIQDSILLKASALTAAEWEQIRKHPEIGAQLLEPLTFLRGVVDLVRQHHEHYDGSGYPEGRKGNDILLGARIIHIADAYEAMRSARSYRKKPLFKEEAILEIKRNSGTQFDPKIVDVFLKVVDNL